MSSLAETPLIAGPPRSRRLVAAGLWLRSNLFSSWWNTLLTALVLYAVVAFVAKALDETNLGGMQPHELAGDTAAATFGAGTTALVTKNTLDDLMLGNERWRNLMMKPSTGTASGVLGAMLGYLASRGLLAGKDQINDAIDYVAGLFGGEEPPAQ